MLLDFFISPRQTTPNLPTAGGSGHVSKGCDTLILSSVQPRLCLDSTVVLLLLTQAHL